MMSTNIALIIQVIQQNSTNHKILVLNLMFGCCLHVAYSKFRILNGVDIFKAGFLKSHNNAVEMVIT